MLGGNTQRKEEAQNFFGEVEEKNRDESIVVKLGN